MSRIRKYALELEVEIADDTSDALVETMLPNVVLYSTAGEAIDTGLFGADDHLDANVVALRYVGPLGPRRMTPDEEAASLKNGGVDNEGRYAPSKETP